MPSSDWAFLGWHVLFGLGPGWMLTDAIFIEIAWQQSTQPEKLRLAAMLNLSASLGSSMAVPLVALAAWCRPLRLGRWVGSSIFAQLVAAIALTIGWRSHVGGVSLVLHAAVFVASVVGNMQQLVVLPWLSRAVGNVEEQGQRVSATMAGGNFGAVLAAGLGAFQEPGGAMRCSVSAFYAMQSALVFVSLIAFGVLVKDPRYSTAVDSTMGRLQLESDASPDALSHDLEPVTTGQLGKSRCCTPFWRHPWVLRVCAVNAMLQVIAWVVIRAMMPFAASSAASETDDPHGAVALGYAVEISLVACLLGATVSVFLHNRALQLVPTFCLAVGPAIVILTMALGWRPSTSGRVGSTLLVICAVTCRFTDGIASPLLYRAVGDPFALQARAEIVQWTGGVAIAATALAAWLLLPLLAAFDSSFQHQNQSIVEHASVNTAGAQGGYSK